MKQRLELLQRIAGEIASLACDGFLRVAIDGVDGAGKTTFADELAGLLRAAGRTVIRASVDGFHQPRVVRYRRGRSSPEGFFADSYDYASLRQALLDPLGSGGSGRYRLATYDHHLDVPVLLPEIVAPPGAILILDGIFLHRPELREAWDFSIFLEVAFSVSIPRGAQRGPGFGSPDPKAPENNRYIGGQKLYFYECSPRRHATLVIDNNDLAAPHVLSSGNEKSGLDESKPDFMQPGKLEN